MVVIELPMKPWRLGLNYPAQGRPKVAGDDLDDSEEVAK